VPSITDRYRRLGAWRGYLFDAALAAVLAALSNPQVQLRGGQVMTEGWQGRAAGPHATPIGMTAQLWTLAVWWMLAAMIIVGLLVQRRWPVAALALAGIGAAAHQVVAYTRNERVPFPKLIDLAVPVVLYILASRSRSRWRSMAALAAVAGAEVAVSLGNALIAGAGPDTEGPDRAAAALKNQAVGLTEPKIIELALIALLALALAYALGEANRTRHAHLRTLEQRAADLEREQRQRVALAAAAERARIGRDLHDVIAHSLSVIVAQAQAALAAQHRHPERTTQAVREVVTVGRDSLAEMRRLVGAFGPDPDAQDRLASPIGVAALPTLIDRVRAAGVPVQFTHDGVSVDLPASVDLSVYRIVQEALTNTLKHAGAGAQVRVRLATGPTYVDVEVTDDGTGPSADPAAGHGNGLRGIAERVNLLGGTLTAGPNPDGGFLVRTRLPVPAGTP